MTKVPSYGRTTAQSADGRRHRRCRAVAVYRHTGFQSPLRSYGSLSMNRALMVAGLVDRVQLTVFPVITGQTGDDPIFLGAADFDLELIDSRTLDGNIQELVYRPTLHA